MEVNKLPLCDVRDVDIVFGRGTQFTLRTCYQKFRQLLLQRKDKYRSSVPKVQNEIVAKIIEEAENDGIKFFQYRPELTMAEEMSREQLRRKIRQMFIDFFKIDDGRRKYDKEASRISSARYRKKRATPANFNRRPEKNPRTAHSAFHSFQAEPAMKHPGVSEMADSRQRRVSYPEPHTAPASNLPTTFGGCIAYLNGSLISIRKKQAAGIKAAQEHLQKLLEEQADVARAETKLAELSMHPERCYGIAPNDLLDSIVQNITGDGGTIGFAPETSTFHNQHADAHSIPQHRQHYDQGPIGREATFDHLHDLRFDQSPGFDTNTTIYSHPNHGVERRLSPVAPNMQCVSHDQASRHPQWTKYTLSVAHWESSTSEPQSVGGENPLDESVVNERVDPSVHMFSQPLEDDWDMHSCTSEQQTQLDGNYGDEPKDNCMTLNHSHAYPELTLGEGDRAPNHDQHHSEMRQSHFVRDLLQTLIPKRHLFQSPATSETNESHGQFPTMEPYALEFKDSNTHDMLKKGATSERKWPGNMAQGEEHETFNNSQWIEKV